jgi:hypothetical protein
MQARRKEESDRTAWRNEINTVNTRAQSTTPNVQSIPKISACPQCGATGTDPCVTSSGNPAKAPHKARAV